MRQEFPYFGKDGQHYPVVDVLLKHGQKEIRVKALIDSGASFSVFRPEVAEFLGIQIEKGRKIYLTGIGGRILGYLHEVSLSIGDKLIRCKIIFSREFNVSFNLLGRDNFFHHFQITFSERAKKVIVASYR